MKEINREIMNENDIKNNGHETIKSNQVITGHSHAKIDSVFAALLKKKQCKGNK